MKWVVFVFLWVLVGVLVGELLGFVFAVFVLGEIEFHGKAWDTYFLAVHIGSPAIGLIVGLFLRARYLQEAAFDFRVAVRRLILWGVGCPLLLWVLLFLLCT